MTNAEGRARPEDQIAAAGVAMAAVADLLRQDVEVVITHGNGPQVGNLLVKNELAAGVPEDQRRKFLGDNARALFKIPG